MASSPTYNPNVDRGELHGDHAHQDGRVPVRGAAARPRDPGPLPAGLDVQGRDRGGRARQRRGQADVRVLDPGYCEEYGKRVSNAGNPETARSSSGRVTLAQGAAALDQLRLLQRRQEDRRREDPRLREALRLLGVARPRVARRRAEPERPLQREAQGLQAAASRVPGRPGPARLRAGADAGDAAADGDGRGDRRERRRPHAAAPARLGARAERRRSSRG